MNCDDARATLHRLTGQTPHTPAPLGMRELAEPDAPAGDRTRVTVPRSWYSLGHYVSGALEAGRSAHSKPRVTCFYFSPTIQCWDVECGCEWLDMDLVNWQAAMDAALAHVRDEHTPKHECPCDICVCDLGAQPPCWAPVPIDGLTDWPPEQQFDMWCNPVPITSTSANHEPKPSTVIELEPAVKDQLQAVLDQFRIPYRETDDDGRVTHRNYNPDAFTTDPAQAMWREALNQAHNEGSRS